MIQARNLVSAIGDYSTSEQDTGFTWIDGKHIYKKTIYIGSLLNNGTKTVAHGISNLSRVIKIEGYSYRSSDHYMFPLPLVYASEIKAQICVLASDTNVFVITGNDRTNCSDTHITLYYIKTS